MSSPDLLSAAIREAAERAAAEALRAALPTICSEIRAALGLRATEQVGPPLLTEAEAAAYIRRSLSGMRKLRKSGAGPRYSMDGKRAKYSPAALQDWIDSHVQERR